MFNNINSFFAAMLFLLVTSSVNATILTTNINSDNDFVAYISTDDSVAGTQFREVNYPPYHWSTTITDTLTLTAGQDYYLHIMARDGGGIGGLIGEFSLDSSDHLFANSLSSLVTGTSYWFGNNEGWGQPYDTSLTDLGAVGVGPWGYSGDLISMDSSAHWIWAGDANTDNVAFFSTKITAAVPEPTILALMGFGLVGLVFTRRRKTEA